MSNQPAVEVIDLTDSFTLANHCALSNVIIELDDSINDANITPVPHNIPPPHDLDYSILVSDERCSVGSRKYRRRKASTPVGKGPRALTLSPKQVSSHKNRSSSIFGDCPICWDELGKNPLASTKCGHVYCLKCLKQCLQAEKKCPTCRTVLRGSAAYHPLYLGRD